MISLGFIRLLADAGCANIPTESTNPDGKTVTTPIKYCTNLTTPDASSTNVENLVHIVGGTLAAIAVLIIVISALNIVTAGGDSAKVAKARSAIVYALVGLAITISATAIVSIIITRL